MLKTVSVSAGWFIVSHIAMCLSMCDGGGIIPATLTDLGHSTGRGSAPLTSCPTELFVAWIAATEKVKVGILERRKT